MKKDKEDLFSMGGLFQGLSKLIQAAQQLQKDGEEIRILGELDPEELKSKVKANYEVRMKIGDLTKEDTSFVNKKFEPHKEPKKTAMKSEVQIEKMETDTYIYYMIELPGISLEHVSYRIDKTDIYLQIQTPQGFVEKVIHLETEPLEEKLSIKLNNGVLTLTLQK